MATATKPAPHRRARPGAKGSGRFFHIELRPRQQFVAFRVQSFGKAGIERVAGRHANGSWDTATWLVDKRRAHVENGRLVGDSDAVRRMPARLGSTPVRVRGDRFRARPRRKIPASEKPTPAMRRAQLANIKKAQAALRARRGGTNRSQGV